MSSSVSATVAVVGGGVVGTAVAHALAHRGVQTILLEAEPDLALAASGTNSGLLHTGFDSTPGALETELILRSAALRPGILGALNIPVLEAGAVLIPRGAGDTETIRDLAENARANGVDVHLREDDGALVVPGEAVTDPVVYTLTLAESAVSAGARVWTGARVVGAKESSRDVLLSLQDGRTVRSDFIVNCAGLNADSIARFFGDESFEIYPRKGEFFVFKLPSNERLEQILLPVPTKRTKGVLVFPTLDGHVVAGPTAVDIDDKSDWSVRPEAFGEVFAKAVRMCQSLADLTPVASYAGLRPAGRGSNYVVGTSSASYRLINAGAIRSTGLSASLGIAERIASIFVDRGIASATQLPPKSPACGPVNLTRPWWARSAEHFSRERAAS